MKKLTTEEFIKRAKKVHGDKYDYSKVAYSGAKTKVCIICSIHGEFWQMPDKHLNGQGCPKCHPLHKKSTEEFIEQAKKVHGDKYDYSKVVYNGALEKVCVICPIHGEFWVYPNNHLNGEICRKCYEDSRKNNRNIFIEQVKKVHGDKYDYSKVEYINSHTKVCIICPIHGEFWQTPANHLNGKGCPKCSGRGLNTEEIIKMFHKIHGNKYDYSKVVFTKMHEKVCIICPIHGEFWQTPSKHIQKHGCPICKQSYLESEMRILLKKNSIFFEQEKTFNWLVNEDTFQNLKLDFYLPDYNIAIECQGIQHFEPTNYFGGIEAFERQIKRDKMKLELCKKNGIKMIYYTNIKDYKMITKKDLVDLIKSTK